MEGAIFNYRVAGITLQNNRLLLHKTPSDNYWSLPGGRVELLEYSQDALKREFIEEIGQEIKVGHLSWIIENFFEYNQQKYHEIGFYYQIQIPGVTDYKDIITHEDGIPYIFRWFSIENIDQLKIYPEIINQKNLANLNNCRHFILKMKDLNALPTE